MRRLLPATLAFAWLAAAPAAAGSLDAVARSEIDALFARLSSSACQVNRNGTWHGAAEAKAHMLRKLRYLEDKGAVKSAEQFIELAATASSASGEPYLVRCGAAAPVASREWLLAQLQRVRAETKPPSPR